MQCRERVLSGRRCALITACAGRRWEEVIVIKRTQQHQCDWETSVSHVGIQFQAFSLRAPATEILHENPETAEGRRT